MLIHSFKKIKVFLPISKYMIAWYALVMFLVITNFYFVVLFVCFESVFSKTLIQYVYEPLLFIISIVDILISFNTSFIKNGELITDKKTIRANYMKSIYLMLDLAVFLCILSQIFHYNPLNEPNPILQLFILVKMIKVKQFDVLIQKYWIRSKRWSLFYAIMKHLLLLVLLCHLIGSFFYLLDKKLIKLKWYQNQQLWVYNSNAYHGIESLSTFEKYCYAFYFAIITLSGCAYGDLTPLNQTQVLYTCFCLLLPMVVYAYLFTKIYRIISDSQKDEDAKELKIKKYKKIIRKYFEQNQIKQQSSLKYIHYLIYIYQIKYSIKNQYFCQIAPKLKQKFICHVLDRQFNFNIFSIFITPHSKLEDIKNIAYQTAQENTFPSKFTFKMQKKQQQKLYFILSGKVHQYVQLGLYKHCKNLNFKTFFGQYTFFTGIAHKHPNHAFQTNNFTICQTIDYTKFRQKLSKNVPILQQFFKVRNKLIFKQHQIKQFQIRCLFCQSDKHILDQCPRLRIKINILSILGQKTQRNNNFIRRKQINYKIYYFPINENISYSKIEQDNNYQEKSIQTCQSYLPKSLLVKRRQMERVENWKYFYPQYSLK